MKIVLSENYYITSDPLNFILVKQSKAKEGSKNPITETNIGFYGTLEKAVDDFLEISRKNSTVEFEGDIRRYVEEIKRANLTTAEIVKRTIHVVVD